MTIKLVPRSASSWFGATHNQENDVQLTENSIETMAGPSEWFTGAVCVDTVATPSGASRLNASSVPSPPAPGRPGTVPGGGSTSATTSTARRRRSTTESTLDGQPARNDAPHADSELRLGVPPDEQRAECSLPMEGVARPTPFQTLAGDELQRSRRPVPSPVGRSLCGTEQ